MQYYHNLLINTKAVQINVVGWAQISEEIPN